MKMTKGQFELIASILKEAQPYSPVGWERPAEFQDWAELVDLFAERLKRTNPQFNPHRFREAAGL
jgi:hypothetical protein